MRARRAWAVLVAGGLVLVMGPAMATGNSYTVAVGGSSTPAQRQLTGSADAPPAYWMEKLDGTFLKMTCASSSIQASAGSAVTAGAGVLDIARIDSFTFSTCSGIGGAPTFTSSGSWKLHGTSAATAAATDTVNVHLEDLTLQYSQPVCQFRVTGGLDGTFNESTQKLTIDEKADGVGQAATVTNVVGCLGQVKNNGKFKFQGTFSTTVAGGAVNIQP